MHVNLVRNHYADRHLWCGIGYFRIWWMDEEFVIAPTPMKEFIILVFFYIIFWTDDCSCRYSVTSTSFAQFIHVSMTFTTQQLMEVVSARKRKKIGCINFIHQFQKCKWMKWQKLMKLCVLCQTKTESSNAVHNKNNNNEKKTRSVYPWASLNHRKNTPWPNVCANPLSLHHHCCTGLRKHASK